MLILVALVALIVIVVAAVLVMKMKNEPAPSKSPYEVKTLFSAAERSFLGVLDQAVPSDYRVFGKVRLGDVAEVKKGLSTSERQSALNKVNAKHLDFLLCDAMDLAPVCAIELDDRSHSSANRQARDSFIEETLTSLGLPLLRVSARKAYSVPEIRQEIERLTGKKIPEVAETAKVAFAQTQEPAQPSPEKKISVESPKGSPVKICPKCGNAMKLKKATKGPNAGQVFWGCGAYPACRTIIKVASSSAT